MAWNRSDGASKVEVRGKGGVAWKRALLAGCFVVIGAIAAWWFLVAGRGEEGAVNEDDSPSRRIKEVAPSIPVSRTNAEDAVKEAIEKPRELPPQKLGEVRNGYVLLGSGLHKIRGEITNNCTLTKGKYEIFKHSAENIIAGLLSMKAGDTLVGEPHYDGAFEASLIRSLKEEIKIEETDTPEQVELKKAVIEAKKELKKAMTLGQDVEQIIMDARHECQELARVKQMMMADVYDFVDKKAVTKDDVETYVEAANKLLESKGIAPIERTTLVDIKLRHKLEDYDPETEEEEEEQ